MAEKEDALSKRDFSRVILTLNNVLIPEDKLSPTPSHQDGLDSETELDLRILGCELIQTCGILLKLPQVAMATGQVLFQRYYYSKSFIKHDMEVVAMACINLASKIEEAPRRIRDVINVVHHFKQVKGGKTISPLILNQDYIDRKNHVIKAERRILKELGFCCHVKHPHKIIVTYLHVLDADNNRRLVQCAWNYMNDSFRSDVFVRYQPEDIACACIFLASRQLQIALPNNPPWFHLFEVEEDTLQDICYNILALYTRPKPNADKLEKTVNEVKMAHIEAKRKAKGQTSAGATPNSGSQAASPAKISPSPLTAPGVRKLKDDDERSVGSNYSGRDHNHKARSKHSRSRSRSRDRGHDRGHDRSRDHRSRSKSRSLSKGRSYSSRSRSRSRTPRSRSVSRSPVYKRKYRSPKRTKKTNKLYSVSKPKRAHKRHRSPSYTRSISRSPDRPKKNKYKDRQRSRSRSVEKYRSDKFLSRSRSRSRENHKIKKRNGHRRSRSREHYRR